METAKTDSAVPVPDASAPDSGLKPPMESSVEAALPDVPAAADPLAAGGAPALELSFVPNWARKPPSSEVGRVSRRGGEGEEGPSGDRRDRRFPRRSRDGQGGRGGGGGRDRPRGGGRPDRRGGGGNRPGTEPGAPEPGLRTLPRVRVALVPSQEKLSAVVRRLRGTRRAYPLMGLAGRLLSRDDGFVVKIETDEKGHAGLFQCKVCGIVGIGRESVLAHTVKAHIGDTFDREETVGEAPTGQFVFVCRCGLSGVLLGPPNHHSYAEKVRETHAARYSHVPLEEYKRKIETIRDPALIEKWKEESRKQVVYRLKGPGEGAGKAMRWGEAEAYFLSNHASSLVAESGKAVVGAEAARKIEDRMLGGAVREIWQKEIRFPRAFSYALRAAFRGMRMHLFRAGRDEFVTAIPPTPLDPAVAVDEIRSVLSYLRDHPGCSRAALVKGLRPGVAPDSSEAAALTKPLNWLIEKGHIVEFFDGSLSAPQSAAKA